MTSYVLRRLIAALVTIWLVMTGVFLLFFVMPGGAGNRIEGGFSPVAVFIAGQNNDRATLRRIERDLGLDGSVMAQYGSYMSRLARGNLGFSYGERGTRQPVNPAVVSSIRPTIELALGASTLALAAGVGGGIMSTRARRRWTNRALAGLSIFCMSVPAFVIGLLAVGLFAAQGITLQGIYQPMSAGLGGWAESMLVPWIVLAFPFAGVYFRLVRAGVLSVGKEDFILTAKATGLREKVVLRHQFRAGAMPLVTAYGVDLANFLGGAIIVESIFGVPGLGNLIVDAIGGGDFPIVAGVTLVAATAVVLLTLVVDIAYTYLDPRITYAAAP